MLRSNGSASRQSGVAVGFNVSGAPETNLNGKHD